MMRGISGSGKSTAARRLQADHPGSIIVCRDDLRLALYNEAFGGNIDEDLISDVERSIIHSGLDRGFTVICDKTNLYPDNFYDTARIAQFYGAKVLLMSVDTPLTQAFENNLKRAEAGGRFVP